MDWIDRARIAKYTKRIHQYERWLMRIDSGFFHLSIAADGRLRENTDEIRQQILRRIELLTGVIASIRRHASA